MAKMRASIQCIVSSVITELIHDDKDWDINSKGTKWRIKYNGKRVTVKAISALGEIRVINARTGNTLSCTVSTNNIDADSRHDIIDTVANNIKNV